MYQTAPYLTYPYPSSSQAYKSILSITTLYIPFLHTSGMELFDIFYVVCDGNKGGLWWFAVVVWVVCDGLGCFAVVCGGLR